MATTLTTSISKSSPSPALIIPHSSLHLSYGDLHRLTDAFQRNLASIGITPKSAVSIALPNNLEFIVSFLAAAGQRAVAAPLNPNYKQAEFEFFINDIQSKLVIVPAGAVKNDAPAVKAARKFGAGIAEVWWDERRKEVVLDVKEAGKLDGEQGADVEAAQEEDVALVLHTSGTTGRPKAVRFYPGEGERGWRG